jgi:hypothetical protein
MRRSNGSSWVATQERSGARPTSIQPENGRKCSRSWRTNYAECVSGLSTRFGKRSGTLNTSESWTRRTNGGEHQPSHRSRRAELLHYRHGGETVEGRNPRKTLENEKRREAVSRCRASTRLLGWFVENCSTHVATLAWEYRSGPSHSQFTAWWRSWGALWADENASGGARSILSPRNPRFPSTRGKPVIGSLRGVCSGGS